MYDHVVDHYTIIVFGCTLFWLAPLKSKLTKCYVRARVTMVVLIFSHVNDHCICSLFVYTSGVSCL